MGVQFKPSDIDKSDGAQCDVEKSDHPKSECKKNDLTDLEEYKASAPEIPISMPELMFSNTEHLETIALPPLPPKKKCRKSTLREFCQHLNGMTPGKTMHCGL